MRRARVARSSPRRCLVPLLVVVLVGSTCAGMLGSAPPAFAAVGDISTFAGSAGTGTATNVAMAVQGIAVSGSSVYIADDTNMVIRKLDTTAGTISVPVGYESAGAFAGDGAAATLARINSPQGVAVDSAGNIYIADTSNNRIRKVTVSTGNISTIAGGASAGNTGDGAAASSALLSAPEDVEVDSSGNVYIADTGNNRVRIICIATCPTGETANNIYNFAGTAAGTAGNTGDGAAATSAGLSAPRGLAIGGTTLYIADSGNNRVRTVPLAGGNIANFAGSSAGTAGNTGDGAAATSATLSGPKGVAVGGTTVYISDTGNNRVRTAPTTGGNIANFAGSSAGTAGSSGDGAAATSATMSGPEGIDVDASSNVYIADTGNATLRKVASGTITKVAGRGSRQNSGDGAAASSAQFLYPKALATDPSGNIYIPTNASQIRKVDISTLNISSFADTSAQGGNTGDGGAATAATFNVPRGVAFDPQGDLYIADTGNNRVRKVDASTGNVSNFAGSSAGTAGATGDGAAATSALLSQPRTVAVDPAGNVYICDTSNNRVRKVDVATGNISNFAGSSAGTSGNTGDGAAATSALLNQPYGVATDNAGNVYIADQGNNRIRKVDSSGNITNFAGNSTGASGNGPDSGVATSAGLNSPWGVSVDAVGNVFIADEANQKVRKVDPSGNISLVAGTGSNGFSGDGGAGSAALLWNPDGVTTDLSGNLYIADYYNHRVRRVLGVAGTPVAPTWTVSKAHPSDTSVRYTWTFTTVTAATLSKVQFWVPSGTANASPTIYDVEGLPGGGTVALSGQKVTYTLTTPTAIPAGVKVTVQIDGFTNTATASTTYRSTVDTFNNAGTPAMVDSGLSNAVDISSSSSAASTPVLQESTTASTSGTIQLLMDPAVNNDVNKTFTVNVGTNATNGYSLSIKSTTLQTGTGVSFPAISTGIATGVASGSFTVDKWGYTLTVGGTAIGAPQGALATAGNYVGFTTAGENAVVATGPATGDTVTVTVRAKIDWKQAAGAYSSTITTNVNPSY